MNYIVMDLEWNQSPKGKSSSIEDMPFEIIEIGAVKLNNSFKIIESFNKYIKPKEYTGLHSKVKEIVRITINDLNKGGKAEDVLKEFLDWCGKDYIFCTWGSTDLIELQRNMKHFNIKTNFPMPFLYYDLQKLYSICFSDGKTRITLQHAIDELEIESDKNFHKASNDAVYTAQILKVLDFDKVKDYYSVDTYKIPASRKEEISLIFEDYEKYISKGFNSREATGMDREVRACKCFLCGEAMKKNVKWFATNNKVYYGLFECDKHGLIKGRIRIKQADNGKYYAVRIMKRTDLTGAAKIKEKKLREQEHRRHKKLSSDNTVKTSEKH